MSGTNGYTVTRSTTVRAPADRPYSEVVDFHRWPAWSPWEDLDPDLHRHYSGADQGPGAVYEWSGNRRAGAGRMEITEVAPHSRVVVDLRFLKPFKSRSTTTFTLEPAGDGQTVVTWTMTGPRTLATRLMGVFTSMDALVGKDFERGLDRLRTLVETPGS